MQGQPGMQPQRQPLAPAQGPAAVQPQIIYIQSAPTGPRIYENYAAKTSKFLGVSRIVIGAVTILLHVAALTLEIVSSSIGPSISGSGIWCGAFVSVYY